MNQIHGECTYLPTKYHLSKTGSMEMKRNTGASSYNINNGNLFQ